MSDRKVDPVLLVECANRLASLLGAEMLAAERVQQIIVDVLYERGTLECVELGVLTEQEAVLLLLAHFQTALRADLVPVSTESWEHRELVACVRRGLFGNA